MKKIEIAGISTSQLGFGCAPIMGAIDKETAKKAIHLALDNGITHFDLARSYGYGEAEKFVGKIIGTKRHEITITSKFGFEANWKSKLAKPLKPLVRYLKNSIQNDKTPNKKIAGNFMNRIEINEANLEKSLNKSMKELNTDYLDFYLIHEPISEINNFESVLTRLLKYKAEGKIRSFGLASDENFLPLHQNYLKNFEVIQANYSLDNLSKYNNNFGTISFGATSNKLHSETVTDYFQRMKLANPNTLFLCSMFSESHIISNAKSFQ